MPFSFPHPASPIESVLAGTTPNTRATRVPPIYRFWGTSFTRRGADGERISYFRQPGIGAADVEALGGGRGGWRIPCSPPKAELVMRLDKRHQTSVLLDPGAYDCLNLGDLAMLEVAISRWKALWPSAAIGVITATPEALAPYGVTPVSVRDRSIWLDTHLLGRLHKWLPRRAASPLEQIERDLKMSGARSLQAALALRHQITRGDGSDIGAFVDWMRCADVVALTGGGALTDSFSVKALRILDTLEMAACRARRYGRPLTAIFGQGFGPLADPALRRRAAEVLPQIDFIAIRENRASRSLLTALGVDKDRIVLTGDDAIELAYDRRQGTVGGALGVNVRVAFYANTDASTLEVVRQAALAAARRHGAPLVPVPITRQPGGTQPYNAGQSDTAAIRDLLAGISLEWNDGPEPDSPADVIREVARCRVVVTGSYHGAVFALAQGIPAIGLAGSPYYRAKFAGLAEQFEGGIQVADMGEAGWGSRLNAAIDTAWATAERMRPILLEAARRQIDLSRQAYVTVARRAALRTASAVRVDPGSVELMAGRLQSPACDGGSGRRSS